MTNVSLPAFQVEAEERNSGKRRLHRLHDWSKALARALSNTNLKPQPTAISFVCLWLAEQIKSPANNRDVPYQSLINVWPGGEGRVFRCHRRLPASSFLYFTRCVMLES